MKTRFKIFLFLLFLILIVGCAPPHEVTKELGEYVCKDQGGLYTILDYQVAGKVAQCHDNSKHSLYGVVIPAN